MSEQGVRELEQYYVQMPHVGHEEVDLDRVWWGYLWDEGLIFKHDIPYDHHERLVNDAQDNGTAGLPLLLRPQRSQPLSWSIQVLPDAVTLLIYAWSCRQLYRRTHPKYAAHTLQLAYS